MNTLPLSDTDICLLIGTCISADTCINEDACNTNIECLLKLKTEWLTAEQQEKYNDYIENSIKVIQRDLKEFKNKK